MGQLFLRMKAAVLRRANEPLLLEELEDPVPKHDEVLVKVEGCGLCHSDLHIWEGHYGAVGTEKMGIKLPLVLGHEIAGSISALGESVTGYRAGERVIVYPWAGDGTCKLCLSGNEQYCASIRPLGLSRDGGFAEKVLVPHYRHLVRAGGELPLETIAPLSCAGITAYSSVKKAQSKPDEYLLIIGIGGLGHMAIELAANLFKPTIIAVDSRNEALDLAKSLGAEYAINPTTQDTTEELKKITHGSRVDAAIDFVGLADTTLGAFKALRRGGRLVITGLSGDYPKFLLPEIPVKGITITGCYVGNMRDLSELLQLARRGFVKPRASKMPLEKINEAMSMMKERRIVGRIIMTTT